MSISEYQCCLMGCTELMLLICDLTERSEILKLGVFVLASSTSDES